MTKEEALELLKKIILKDNSLPLKDKATKLVFGVGNPDADLFFLGEAPGFYEDQQGEPFVGTAGKLLNKNLSAIGLDRKDIFITNVVLYRPPNNRDPEESELKAFEKYVDKMIAIVSPKVIVTLGRFSMRKFIPNAKITAVHGNIFKIQYGKDNKEFIVFPMFHPAAALRSQEILQMFNKDFIKLKQTINEV